MTGTLTTILETTSPSGVTDTVRQIEVLTEESLLRAGISLISKKPNDQGWVVISLRAIL